MEPITITVTNTITLPSRRALEAIERAQHLAGEIEDVRLAGDNDAMSALAAERAEAIRDALDEGMSQADVGRCLGITAQAVNLILRQH